MIYRLSDKRPMLSQNPLLAEANELELRVYLCLLEKGEADVISLSKDALCTEDEAQSALQFWRGAGCVRATRGSVRSAEATNAPMASADTDRGANANEEGAAPHKGSAPRMHEAKLALRTGEEIAAIIEQRHLASFLDACQGVAGRVFNEREIAIAVSLCDELGLSPEYVLTLIAHCFGMGKSSMAYVEKVAFSFVLDRKIDTAEKLDAHIAALEKMHSCEGQIRRLFGIGERALTKKEEAALLCWLSEFSYGMEMIEAAYDKTVASTGKASVLYCNKILAHWHEMGCKTLADANALELREAESRQKKSTAPKPVRTEGAQSFDVDDFFNRALKRSYGDSDSGTK